MQIRLLKHDEYSVTIAEKRPVFNSLGLAYDTCMHGAKRMPDGWTSTFIRSFAVIFGVCFTLGTFLGDLSPTALQATLAQWRLNAFSPLGINTYSWAMFKGPMTQTAIGYLGYLDRDGHELGRFTLQDVGIDRLIPSSREKLYDTAMGAPYDLYMKNLIRLQCAQAPAGTVAIGYFHGIVYTETLQQEGGATFPLQYIAEPPESCQS